MDLKGARGEDSDGVSKSMDDGKRALSAIEVVFQGASPLEGGLGETIAGRYGFTGI